MTRPLAVLLAMLVIVAAILVFVLTRQSEPAPDPVATGSVESGETRTRPASAAVTVSEAFANPASAGTGLSAAYFTLTSQTSAQRLVGVSSPRARAELRRSTTATAATLDIPAGGVLTLEPGGVHVRLTDIDGPLIAGDTLEMVLEFGDGSTLRTRVPVRDAGL